MNTGSRVHPQAALETPKNVTGITSADRVLNYSLFATEAGTQLHDFQLEKGVEE